ncbi:MAG: hypothetical protein E7160_03465 [Firmicutes bacterium]|nr:hypothetical protein [Bacillota bacterium]
MSKEEEKYEFSWLDNPSVVTSIIIMLISFIIILSQSFLVNNELTTFAVMSNVINHNSIYLLALVYFILIKFNFGKKYFNYLNLVLILLYLFISVTSLLTLFQTFSLIKIFSLLLNLSIFTYLFHTMLKGTRVWREFGLSKSIFNDITNDMYFYLVVVLSMILLALNLIFTTSFNGTVLTMLDSIYIIMFSRYIYLFGAYLDHKSTRPELNLNDMKDSALHVVSEIVEKTEETFEKVSGEANKKSAKKTSKSRGDK